MDKQKNDVEQSQLKSKLESRWIAVFTKLSKLRQHLIPHCSVVRRNPSRSPEGWVIRFRQKVGDKTVLRAVYLGSSAIAERAKAVIQQWKEQALTSEQRRERMLGTATGVAEGNGIGDCGQRLASWRRSKRRGSHYTKNLSGKRGAGGPRELEGQ
jgi:hypothetical protein